MSDTVPVEAEQARKPDITAPTTSKAQHNELVNKVERTVSGHTPNFNPRPVTGNDPLPDHPSWKQTGAERVGSEEPNIVMEEVKHEWNDFRFHAGNLLKRVGGGFSEKRSRLTGKNWTGPIRRRVSGIAEQLRKKVKYTPQEIE